MRNLRLYTIPIILFITIVGTYAQTTLEVCSTCRHRSIQSAIETAKPHDTLVILKGIFSEYNIKVDKPITITGIDLPTIDGMDKGEIFTIVADSVTIKGLRIVNVGTSYQKDYAAVRVVKSQAFTIQGLVLEKLFFGIYLEKSHHGVVRDNRIIGDAVNEYNSGNGIQLWYSHNVIIDNNYITNVRDGIYLEFADDCQITCNESTENIRYGLHFMFSNNDIYEANTFRKNGAGVAVMFSKGIKMYDNLFIENWGTASYGMLLKEINDAEITGNRFVENTTGINIEGSNRVFYRNNEFEGNGWALKSRGACYSNIFSENNFLNNSFDLSYNSNINDNRFEGNYWSEYSGYDLNKDGVGDVPYRPVKLFSYVANRTPEAIVLLRSLFIAIVDFSEKVSPVFTPENLTDPSPSMKRISYDSHR